SFFFSSRRRHTRFSRDWSSDVCSSDLLPTGERSMTTVKTLAALQREHDRIEAAKLRELQKRFTQLQTLRKNIDTELLVLADEIRSEERRVGKECRDRWARYPGKRKYTQ